MAKLRDILLTPDNRPKVLVDCVKLLENEVARKRGVSGMAIKAGFAVLKKVKPGMVEESMDSLLDEFVYKLEPMHDEWEAAQRKPGLEVFVPRNRGRIADTLLGITDVRADTSEHQIVKKTYLKLRPSAAKQIEEALPAVAELLKKYV